MAEQPAPEPTDDGRRTSVRSSAEPDDTKPDKTEPDQTKPDQTDANEPAGSRWRAVTVVFMVAAVALALDIVTKQLVVAHLRIGEPVRIIPGLLYFNSDRNGGAAFSMGTSITWVFPTIAIIVSGTIVYLARSVRSVAWAIALGLVLAGALGNLVDRLFRAPGPFRGEVVDFIALFNGSAHGFAIFNVADSCLTIGVILAVLLELLGRHRDGSRTRH
ncbi:MAG TPA: signal peptidase II [Micromonosporaceae bacterium]|nr:signal peptidase II [Micromonosporaceae bacterium]